MGCCNAEAAGEFFTERVAQRDARRYRKKGLDARARAVVDFLRSHEVEGRRVLEVGGGTGTIQLELLKAGAERAVNVELSHAYEREARALAEEAGVAARVERVLGDFVERAPELEPADIVVMHKVVCCYPDYRSLVGAGAGRASRYLVLTFPRESWWVRAGIRVANAIEWARRHTFRAYVHPPDAILAVARAHGLRPIHQHRGVIWQLAALERRA